MNKNILVTGAQGMVGSRFVELYPNKKELFTPTISEFDFLKDKVMERYLRDKNITHVVNFAAYTDVSSAEKERGDKNGYCWKINVQGLKNLISLFDRNKVNFIHISTDMVFSGGKDDPGPYDEKHRLEDDPNKVTWYGYSKGVGEVLVFEYFKHPTIVRIINPVRAKYNLKLDYFRKPLRLYNEGKLYPLFDDQQINITFVDELTRMLLILINQNRNEIFHCASTNLSTPYELINYVIEAKYQVKNAVKRTSIYDYLRNSDNTFRYPIFGGLMSTKTQIKLNITFLKWQKIIEKLLIQGIGT